MKNTLFAIFTLLILTSLVCEPLQSINSGFSPILIDLEVIEDTKKRIENNDTALQPALKKLIRDAEISLKKGPYSVTDKEKLPPSGDKHDYASYSRYWWPDPNQPDGLPYIRKDGETYPGSQSPKETDRKRIGALGRDTETLGLAYYLTDDEKYAEKTAELLRVWFLDSATYMNPNVNHAQCRLGHNNGSKSGVLDGRILITALESSLLIAGSPAFSTSEHQALKTWAKAYFEWLTTNEMALQEAATKNNHGSFYDVQAIYFALFAGEHEAAKEIALKFAEHRLLSQIEPDGSMPEELARTRPLFYSMYNLHAMFLVGHLASKVDVDVYKIGEEDSRLRNGLDYLVPYANPETTWPYSSISKADRMEMFAILQMADKAYPDGNYLSFIDALPLDRRQIQRNNLAFPLMR